MKKIRRLTALLIMVTMAFMLAACAAKETKGPDSSNDVQKTEPGTTASPSTSPSTSPSAGPVVVNVALHEEATSLDNVTETKDMALLMAMNVFETLYCYDANMNLKPMLAESDEMSADGLTAKIKIREGVKFHDGSEMLAEDVVASLQRFLEYGVKGKSMANYVKSVEAEGNYTVVINFSEVYSVWRDMLSWYSGCWYVIPKEIAEAAGEKAMGWDQNIGTGPFKFDSYEQGRYIKLTKFDGYVSRTEAPSAASGKREVFIDELYFHVVPDASTRLNGLKAGQYDYICNVPTDYYETIKQTDGIRPLVINADRFLTLYLNGKSKLFANNLKMKEAVVTALNMTDAMAAAYGNPELWSTDTVTWYPEGNIYHYEPDIPWFDKADSEKAAALAKEAGYKGEPIRCLVNTSYPTFLAAMTVFMQNMTDAGFKVTEERLDNTSLMALRSDPEKWELFVTHNNYLAVPTAHNVMNPSYAGWWDTEERNTLVSKFVTAMTEAERVNAWKEIIDLMNKQIPLVRVGNFKDLHAVSDKLTGIGDVYYDYPIWWGVKKSD
jgi:peptide/nickel transport system substrate-binding protein